MTLIKHIVVRNPVNILPYELEEWSDEGKTYVRSSFLMEEAYWWYRMSIDGWMGKIVLPSTTIADIEGEDKIKLEEKRTLTFCPTFL